MTVSQLIHELQQLDGNLVVFYEVDGEARRTGDFFRVGEISSPREFIKLTFGGWDDRTEKCEWTTGEPVLGVVIE